MNALMREFEQDLSARLEMLFRRCPALCGFTVQADGPMPSHVTCSPVQNQEQAEALYGEVAEMLLELADECPEEAELLHGRTFARTVH